MNHKALEELRAIIKLPDWAEFCPEKLREQQLEDWINRWIVEVEFTQAVVDTKYLTSEYEDKIKIKLAQGQAEELAETCTSYKVTDRKVTAALTAFRRISK